MQFAGGEREKRRWGVGKGGRKGGGRKGREGVRREETMWTFFAKGTNTPERQGASGDADTHRAKKHRSPPNATKTRPRRGQHEWFSR